ncbi:MAG: InlB B-repeat-containing protein [Paludibacteraceae bacterium]|nr:InlB B-repeat-containing protein [Paludibacteraceae bacterium]
MTTSTSFAQMANNQSISLSSALRANTPPIKKSSSSRKFLSLSIFFRLLLVMFLTLTVSAEVWGALSSPYECLFKTTSTLTNNQVTTGDVTWTLTTVTGKGSPTTTFGNTNGQSAIKLGSGKNNYYSKMTLKTSAFSAYNVSKVVLYISSNNGGKKTITVKQRDTQIGTVNQSFTSTTWVTNCTLNATKGSGGDLSIEISSDATATFIHSITVTYETAAPTTYTVTLNPNYPEGKTGVFKDKSNKTINGNLVLSYPSGTASMQITSLYNSLTLDGYDFGGWYNAKGINPGDVSGSSCTCTGNITGDKTYYAKWTQKVYTVTATSNNNNYGTVSVSGTTITASPKTGYTYANPAYTVTSGTAIVTQNGNTFTVSPSTNCTVCINFEAKPKYTVTLVPGSGSVTDTELEEPNAGDGVTLPTPTLSSACQLEGWTFAGWKTTSAVATETTTKPTLIAAGTYSPTSDITLYAVYQRTEESAGGGSSEENVVFSAQGYTNQQEVSSYDGTNFSVAFDKGSNSNTPKYYTSGTAIRIYGGGYFTVSSETTITKIVLGFGSSDGSNAITTDVNTYSNGTWTGSANSVKFTIGGSSGNRRLSSLTVTTSGGGSSTTYYHSTPECGPQKLATPNVELTYNCSSATITWDAVTNAKAYWYQIIKTGDTSSGTSSTNTTYTRNGIEPGVSYTWSVKAIGDGSKFSDSEIATGTFTAYSIQWLANGELIENACGKAGEAIVVPTPNLASCDGTKEFVGWTATPIDGSIDTEPNDLFTESPGSITDNATYHAVFATKSTGSGETTIIKTETFSNQTSHQSESNWQQALTWGAGESNIGVQWTTYYGKIDNGYTEIRTYSNEEMGYIWSSQKIKGIKSIQFNGWHVTESDAADMVISYSKNNDNDWIEIGTHTAGNSPDSRSEVYTIPEAGPEEEYYISIDLHNATCPSSSNKKYRIDNISLTILEGANTPTTYSGYVTTCDNTKATITYDLNGGTGATCEQQTVTKGEAFTLCNQTPTKTGYNFAGWTDGVNTYDEGASTSVTDNTKFYAKWTAKTITITWNQNYTGCPEPIEMQYVYDSDENTMPEEPVREGYQFVGWFTEETNGIEITEIGEENRPTGNVTYYAHWNELYSVTFMVSGQVYLVQEDKYINGDAIELPAEPSAANYACDGYVFDGWSALEKPTEDATKPELITASTTIDADREFHAVWAKSSTGAIQTDFVKVTVAKDDWTGDYVIVNEDAKKAIGNAYKENTSSNKTLAAVAVTITDNKVVSPSEDIIWQIRKNGENYTMYNAAEEKYAYVTDDDSRKAGLSNSPQDMNISWGSDATKTRVYSLDYARCFSYYSSNSEWRTYGTSNNSTGTLFYRPVASYTYTTHPNCGPTIVAKDDMWVTSSNGQSVKINVPIAVKSFTNTATITGTSTSSNFVVTPLENVTNGINDVVEVIYTPTTADTKENTTITLTAKNGEEIWCTTTFTLNGRSLPDEFVIVAQYGDKWLALPANMQSGADQYNGIEVTPNNALTQIPAAPSTTIYSLRGVADNRYEDAGTCVRLVGNGNKCLWGNAATTNTTIQNWTTLGTTNGSNYEWLLTTSDGELYTIANPEHPDYDEGRILSNSGSKYGLYKGTTKFYILPVGCSSQPGNIQVTARRVDATFSWEGSASSMKIDVYTNDAMTEVNISNTATASPYYMTGLSESTQYWFKMTPNGTDDDDCAYTGSFKTTGPTIDVVEWQENAAVIFVDKDEELNPLVIIDGEVEHGVGTGSQATELFFSKYFEAHAENKLLAIYNGTANTIDLTGYVIRQENAELNLALYGKTKGKIAPNEEIILVYFDATYSAESCAKQQDNYETWNVLNDKSVLAFSGRGSIGLYKNNVLIDVIGSTSPSGELTKIGKSGSPDNCGTEDDVRLYVDGFSVNDQSSFFCYYGDNIKTPEVENDYAISTNRCLLIRKNSVTSGANAVANNKADAGATCGDLSTTFTTLCSEWSGFRIGGGKSSNEEIKDATCDGLGYVGGFDYNQYYKEYTNIDNDIYLEDYTHDDDTKEYIIPIENLAKYSCLNIRFQLKKDDQVLTEEPVQVPIIVSGEKATNDAIFNAIVKTDASEPEYEQSIERCKTCNVVVLSDATLTKAANDATNDVAEVYNMKVYPGGQVVVPAETNYTVNSLAFRRQEDEVSMANIQGKLTVKHANGVYLDVRIDPSNWHYMTLPYDCRVGDVTFADGTPAVVNTDYLLGWYDGAYRAEHKTGGWTYITDNDYILKKGLGYIVALPGNGKVRREIRFPMANNVIAEDLESKTVSGLYAYGGDKTDAELRPNHKGWNMIGSPYLYTYTTDIVKEPLQMGTLEHSPVNPWDGTWVRTGNLRYIVEPIDNGWSGYEQKTIDYLKPFTSYFIQVGGELENGEYTTITPETEQQIVFAANSVARNASAPRKVAEAEVMDNHPVWYGVEMIAPNNEKDNTTLLISNEFTDGYDMMDDLVKMRGDYYQYYNFPVLASRNDEGEMAFNALPDSSAAKIGVPLSYYAATAGTYTIATDGRFDLEEVKAAMLYDATTAQYTNLLTENYSFTTNKGNNTNRFTLFVTVERKKVPNITTGMDNLLANGQLSLIAVERTLVLSGLTENADIYVYDMSGKMVTGTHSAGENGIWRTTVPATGVYFVRVNSANSQQTLRTIVK